MRTIGIPVSARAVSAFLNGQGIPDHNQRGERIVDDSFVLCFNAHHEAIEFTLPGAQLGAEWTTVIDTGSLHRPEGDTFEPDSSIKVAARSLVVLQSPQVVAEV